MQSYILGPLLGLLINLWFVLTVSYFAFFVPPQATVFFSQPFGFFMAIELLVIGLLAFKWENDLRFKLFGIGVCVLIAAIPLYLINQSSIYIYFVFSVLASFIAKPLARAVEEKEREALAIRTASFLAAIFLFIPLSDFIPELRGEHLTMIDPEALSGLSMLLIYHLLAAITTFSQNFTKYALTVTALLPFISLLTWGILSLN